MSRTQHDQTMWLDTSQGITAAKFLDALERGGSAARAYHEVQRFMASERAQMRASAVFEVLAQAEAAAHGVATREVHFHEVGRLENLARVFGIFAALEAMGIAHWYASPPTVGNGTITCSHGELPVPAPATRRIIEAHNIPITEIPEEPIVGELSTPTGVALLTQAEGFMNEPPEGVLILRTRIL
ncbi:MAG: LarC family nickel insertion protein [Actinomycetia bacterium]|nr:LarC family nickel insertion protein [Actinomycetes bacterium]